MYELLTWSPPYLNDNPHFVMMKVASEDYRMPISDDFDPFFHKILNMSWHPDPNSRPSFESLVEMIDVCHKETSLMKFKGDWRDTLKTFRVATMRKANSKKRGKDGSGSPLFAEAPRRRGSISEAGGVGRGGVVGGGGGGAGGEDGGGGGSARNKPPNQTTSALKNRISLFRKRQLGNANSDGDSGKRKGIALQAAEASELMHKGTSFAEYAKTKNKGESEEV